MYYSYVHWPWLSVTWIVRYTKSPDLDSADKFWHIIYNYSATLIICLYISSYLNYIRVHCLSHLIELFISTAGSCISQRTILTYPGIKQNFIVTKSVPICRSFFLQRSRQELLQPLYLLILKVLKNCFVISLC